MMGKPLNRYLDSNTHDDSHLPKRHISRLFLMIKYHGKYYRYSYRGKWILFKNLALVLKVSMITKLAAEDLAMISSIYSPPFASDLGISGIYSASLTGDADS